MAAAKQKILRGPGACRQLGLGTIFGVTIFGVTIFEITKEIPVKLKSHCWDDFFQKWSLTPPSKGVFLRPNFMVDFFLFRIIFKGFFYCKLKTSSLFW